MGCPALGGSTEFLRQHLVAARTTNINAAMPMNSGKCLLMFSRKNIIKPCHIEKIVAFDS